MLQIPGNVIDIMYLGTVTLFTFLMIYTIQMKRQSSLLRKTQSGCLAGTDSLETSVEWFTCICLHANHILHFSIMGFFRKETEWEGNKMHNISISHSCLEGIFLVILIELELHKVYGVYNNFIVLKLILVY